MPIDNPYLQQSESGGLSPWLMLTNALMGLGSGISQAGGAGQNWAAGVAPGLMMGMNMFGRQQAAVEDRRQKAAQFDLLMQGYKDKQAERARKERAIQEAASEFSPGFNVKPPAVRMGPDSYDTRLAGYEGGARNGGMVFNELGSGAFGPYQFMPATWEAVRAQNPSLNLPADMTMPGATPEERRRAHDAAHAAFKAGNARSLQEAGFQPTPDNLYLAHRFGVGGALSVLRAEPGKMLSDILPIDWQRQNPDMRGQTAGGFRRLAAERVGGVGAPYDMPQTTTQYAMQPKALPSFDGPMLSLSPRGTDRFMPGVLPTFDSQPDVTAPVMPQPQYKVTPVQSAPTAATPATSAAPTLAEVAKPELPAADAVRIRRAILAGSMTPEQGRTEARQIVSDIWNAQKEQARARFQQESENYRHQRGLQVESDRHERNRQEEGEWVRGADGVERFVPKAERKAGDVRYDKPPDAPQPGTDAGDYRVLMDGANAGKIDTREYAAAYNRIRSKTIDIGNGQKLPPDMRAFPEPTFKEAQERPPPQPIGERERKFTESESKNHVYATQLNNAIPQLEALVREDDGTYSTKNLPGNYDQVKARSDMVPEFMVSEKAKRFRELEMAILTGTLRPASGATILPSEFVSERAKYIPQPGDTSEQIRSKLDALKKVAAAIAEGTGREKALYPHLFKQEEEKPKAAPIRIDTSGRRQ